MGSKGFISQWPSIGCMSMSLQSSSFCIYSSSEFVTIDTIHYIIYSFIVSSLRSSSVYFFFPPSSWSSCLLAFAFTFPNVIVSFSLRTRHTSRSRRSWLLEVSVFDVFIFFSSYSNTLCKLSPPGRHTKALRIGDGPILSPNLAETVVLSFDIFPMLSALSAEAPVIAFSMEPGASAFAPYYMRLLAGWVSKAFLKFSYDSSGK